METVFLQMDRAKSHKQSKLAVDDSYIKIDKQRKGSTDNFENAISRRLLGKSLEDITYPDRKPGKSASFCQPSTTAIVSGNSQPTPHATIAVLNEKPKRDTSDFGFPSTSKQQL